MNVDYIGPRRNDKNIAVEDQRSCSFFMYTLCFKIANSAIAQKSHFLRVAKGTLICHLLKVS